MIDEFQDNNRLQKEILYLLGEKKDTELPRVPSAGELDPGKLFFVGDEKQSIYRFRGADVSVFKELAGEVEEAGGVSLSLPINYRAEPALIDFYNGVFEALMTDARENYEACFEGLQSREAKLSDRSRIRILYKPQKEVRDDGLVDDDDAEAVAVARFIKNSVENEELEVFENDSIRPAGYGDFALLMRSTSNQNRYERAFRTLGIPHTVDSIRSLFLESPINDIYNLLQLAVYPEDRMAYAAVLRSPLANISDEGMLVLLLSSDAPLAEAAIHDPRIGDADRSKLTQASEIYDHIRSKADRIPIATLLSDIWYRYGYRYALLTASTLHPYHEYYDHLRELARTADSASTTLVGFLDTIRPHMGRYERIRDLEILKDEENTLPGVRILTVHKAKGLEFPVVILSNTGNRGITSESAAPFYFSAEFGVTFNIAREGSGKKVNYFYNLGKDEQTRKDIAEVKRVLYVALTRAKHHLVISGRHTTRNRKDRGVPLNMALTSLGWEPGTDVQTEEKLRPFIEEIPDVPLEFFAYQRGGGATGNTNGAGAAKDLDAVVRMYRNAQSPVTPQAPNDWTATGLEALHFDGDAPSRELPGLACDSILAEEEAEAAFGTLCHSMLEADLTGDGSSFRVPALLRERFSEDDLDIVTGEAKRLTTGFLASAAGKLLDGARGVDTEVPFLMRHEQNGSAAVISGVIDLLVDRGDEQIIIDFKTDKFVREGEYFLQGSIYRLAVSEWTGLPVRCFISYIRDNTMIEVPQLPIPDFFSIVGETYDR
jgi:ATP-dependent exoDNAse (exonuclease V) beta subunit